MNMSENFNLSRRVFMVSASSLLVGSRLFGLDSLVDQTPQKVLKLKDELTQEELAWIQKSSMAKDLKNFFGQGLSCAESLFLVALRYMKKPEELVWVASGFGGGMYHRNLCGFLTAGIMAIGVRAGMLETERKEAKEQTKQWVKAYWTWWTSQAPLCCSDIRTEGTTSQVCHRLGQLAAAKTQELITL
jgi:C_GCAxxG_C_C family probable redox protein